MTHSYVDGELDALTMVRIESHVRTCATCEWRLREQMDLRAAIKAEIPYFKASAELHKRMQAELRKPKKQHWPVSVSAWRWPSIGAVASSVVLFSVSLALVLSIPSTDELIAREVVSSHVRSLMANHLTDIRSTDQHTVKPWFIGELDFSPPVHDLEPHGFVLVGGRLDYLNNRQVAALVYQYRKHIINLFIWPTTQGRILNIKASRWQGYEVYEWTQAGMHFWAVSDINENEFHQFARLLQAASTATQPQ